MVDQPNEDRPNNDAALYLLGMASLVASFVLALMWAFSQWWV